MNRRHFIKKSGVSLTIPFLINGLDIFAQAESPFLSGMDPFDDKILILIQMNGGNDGLNMVIPIDQYEGLMRVRSNIALPESKVLKLTDKLGLHSRMTGLATMYKEEKLGILQSVSHCDREQKLPQFLPPLIGSMSSVTSSPKSSVGTQIEPVHVCGIRSLFCLNNSQFTI